METMQVQVDAESTVRLTTDLSLFIGYEKQLDS